MSTPSRNYPKGLARRDELLTTALRLFADSGYSCASLREVARQVGLSLTGIIHHFGTRENLLTAILQERDDADVPALRAAAPPVKPTVRKKTIRCRDREGWSNYKRNYMRRATYVVAGDEED